MILKLFLFWRVGLLIVTFLGSVAFPVSSNGGLGAPTLTKDFDYWLSWAQWDGGHYFVIAQRGYQNFTDYAFFPLFPMLAKTGDIFLPGGLLLSGLIVSNLAFLLFLAVFHRYLYTNYGREISANAIFTYLFFPTTFFAVSYYTESLFLLLCALTFLFLNRKTLLFASLAVSAASLTRQIGIFLAIPVFYNYFSQTTRRISTKILIPVVSLFGFAVYLIYLFAQTNDPFKFLTVQSLWLREPNDPVTTIIGHLATALTTSQSFDFYMDLVLTILFLALLVAGIKKIPSSIWIFSMLAILIPASTGTLTSMSRYALASLGAFIILGDFLKDHPRFRAPVWSISLLLQAVLAARFINGYWVA
jgi:hypothetical protein